MINALEILVHKYLHIPYRLHVHVDQNVKSARATVLLLHGMGNSSASWDEVVRKLPNDIRVISVDLLGFGKSPRPHWLKYNIDIQAKSVIATLLRRNIRKQLIIVGHSMGSLTAIEITKRYPILVKSLILCSPPLYSEEEKKSILPSQGQLLKDFYRLILKNPASVVSVVPMAIRLRVVGKSFDVTRETVSIYLAALESSILHQSSLKDLIRLKKPVRLLHGMLDPVVVKKNLDEAVTANTRIRLSQVVAGHELMGAYIPAVVKAVKQAVEVTK